MVKSQWAIKVSLYGILYVRGEEIKGEESLVDNVTMCEMM